MFIGHRSSKPQHRCHSCGQARGFTLIELLVAIGILAIIALATGAMFANIKTSNERSQVALTALQNAQRTMLIMERDFLQMVSRPPRVQGESNKTIVSGGDFKLESDEGSVAFVRNGWHNPQLRLPRSSLQRVIYIMQENQLLRRHFMHVDAVINSEPRDRILLDNIEDFEVVAAWAYSDEELDWQEDFEEPNLPLAVKVTIVSKDFGQLERVFQVAP